MLGNNFVMGCHALPAIHDKQYSVRFVNRLQRLLGHRMQDAFFNNRLEATGIHHQIGFVPYSALTVMTIPCQTGDISNNGIAGAGEAVKQG